MFTGLVETTGTIKTIERRASSAILTIEPSGVPARIGDSVAVNGICLTVTKISKGLFSFDVSNETIKKTTIGDWKAGQLVNLETSLKAGDEIGGHFVSGHVDEVGSVSSVKKEGQDSRYKIKMSKDFVKYLVPQGSVGVDGISLTVAAIGADHFEIVIIPHTLKMTNMKNFKVGTKVNLEADMLGKYVVGYLQKSKG